MNDLEIMSSREFADDRPLRKLRAQMDESEQREL
jgi:hypothetical protein